MSWKLCSISFKASSGLIERDEAVDDVGADGDQVGGVGTQILNQLDGLPVLDDCLLEGTRPGLQMCNAHQNRNH